jgi:hypothetical protein
MDMCIFYYNWMTCVKKIFHLCKFDCRLWNTDLTFISAGFITHCRISGVFFDQEGSVTVIGENDFRVKCC